MSVLSFALACSIYWKSSWFIRPNNPLNIVGYLRVLNNCDTDKKIKHYVITLVIFILILMSACSVWIELFVIQPLLN